METWEVQVTVVPAQYRPSARVKNRKTLGKRVYLREYERS